MNFDERWLQAGGVVPVDVHTTFALVGEIQRLRSGRDSIVEECARVCDLLAGLNVQGWGRKSTSAARKCAAEIRALKGKPYVASIEKQCWQCGRQFRAGISVCYHPGPCGAIVDKDGNVTAKVAFGADRA